MFPRKPCYEQYLRNGNFNSSSQLYKLVALFTFNLQPEESSASHKSTFAVTQLTRKPDLFEPAQYADFINTSV